MRVPASRFRRRRGAALRPRGEECRGSADAACALFSGEDGDETRPLRRGVDVPDQNLPSRQAVLSRMELRFSAGGVQEGRGEGVMGYWGAGVLGGFAGSRARGLAVLIGYADTRAPIGYADTRARGLAVPGPRSRCFAEALENCTEYREPASPRARVSHCEPASPRARVSHCEPASPRARVSHREPASPRARVTNRHREKTHDAE